MPSFVSGAAGFLGLALVASAAELRAQQRADPAFRPAVATAAFAAGTGPIVAVDRAHRNFHTATGRYATFAEILRADGYRVTELAEPFSAASLREVGVLVVANAGTDSTASWSLPTPSAFTDAEIDAVVAWVGAGGALLLIADHMPAAGATAPLASRFGLRFTNGYTYGRRAAGLPGDRFTRADGTIRDHSITRGRGDSEWVDTVLTFTGQAFQAAGPVDTLLVFGPEATTLLPQEAGRGFDDRTPRVFSGGWLHAAALAFGSGRVAAFGEAAMFSAQLAGPEGRPMGLNHPAAIHNQRLLLNALRWLSGVIGPGRR